MVTKGVVRHVRRRDRGDYFVLFTPPASSASTKRMAFRTRFVHMAVGYPGVRFLDDLQQYRRLQARQDAAPVPSVPSVPSVPPDGGDSSTQNDE